MTDARPIAGLPPSLYIYIYIHVYINMYTHTQTYAHTHTHTHIYMYIYIHIYMCVCVCIYVYIHLYSEAFGRVIIVHWDAVVNVGLGIAVIDEVQTEEGYK